MNISAFLTPPKTIAVVGLSDKPERPSYQVASYLREHGFTIIPVNPTISNWQGIPSYPSILSIPQEVRIDIVDIFRQSVEVPSIVQEVIKSARQPLIWMQEGVVSPAAKSLAEAHGLEVVMDACLMKAHQRKQL